MGISTALAWRLVAGDGAGGRCRTLRGGPAVLPSIGPPRTTSTPEASVGRWGSFWKPGQGLTSPADVAEPASSYMGMAGAYGSHIPEPLPEDEPTRQEPPNRPRRYPAVPGTDRGRPSHITPPPGPTIPDVPEGTELHLRAGEWSNLHGMLPSATVDMTVTAVHPDWRCATDDEVWVSGHPLQCSVDRSDQHAPHMRLVVRLDALRRAVGQ